MNTPAMLLIGFLIYIGAISALVIDTHLSAFMAGMATIFFLSGMGKE